MAESKSEQTPQAEQPAVHFPVVEGEGEGEEKVPGQLVKAVQEGNCQLVSALLEAQADASFQDDSGRSLLMLAAGCGHRDVAALLLEAGAPWNALDKENNSAGEYALRGGHTELYERLLDAGCRAELLLKYVTEPPAPNHDFLKSKLRFVDNTILDANNDAVMMGWEGPLMDLHARVLCPEPGKDVLNIGFGLGLIDSALQSLSPRTHTIVEAHPDIWAHMHETGWDKKPGVKLVFGRWQDVIGELGSFDGVFFDTFGEHYEAMREFHEHLDHLLKPDGVYSFFNGLAASTTPFFHAVYCRVVELELLQKDLSTQFLSYSVDEILKEEKWRGVRRKYFVLDTYNLPIVQRADIIECGEEPNDPLEEPATAQVKTARDQDVHSEEPSKRQKVEG